MPVKNQKSKKSKAEVAEREVVHDHVFTEIYKVGNRSDYHGAMTVETMKGILGWCEDLEEAHNAGFDDPLFYIGEGKERKGIWFLNNRGNRPFTQSWAEAIGMDVLNFNFKLNGETIIVDEYGDVKSGQHRGGGLLLAEIERTGPRAAYWKKRGWTGPVTMETVVVYGISSDPEVIRTLDNVKPRTAADVFYGSGLFGRIKPKDEKRLTHLLDNSVRYIWSRTGMGNDAFSSKRGTVSELVDFHERHPRLLKMLKHVTQGMKDKDGIPTLRLGIGRIVGLAYLMAAGGSDGDKYWAMNSPSEKKINFSLWDKACEFWSLISKSSEEVAPVRNAIASLHGASGEGDGSPREKEAVLCRAWQKFINEEDLTEEAIALGSADYFKKGDRYVMIAQETVGGIDQGDPSVPKVPDKPPVTEEDTDLGQDDETEKGVEEGVVEEEEEEIQEEVEDNPLLDEIDKEVEEEESREDAKARRKRAKQERKNKARREKRKAARNGEPSGIPSEDEEQVLADDD